MATLFVPLKNYEVNSGSEVRLTAIVIGERDRNRRRLVWSNKEGLIQNGQFRAPEMNEDTNFEVKVHMEADTNKSETINVLVKKRVEKPEKPKDKSAIIEAIGAQGSYFIKVQVLDGRKVTVAFTEVSTKGASILPGEKRTLKKITNEQGYLVIQVSPFKQETRVFDVQIIGSEQKQRLYLDGPKKETCPRCNSPAWNGTRCRDCNYPKKQIVR